MKELFFTSKEMKAIGSEQRACKKTLYLSFPSESKLYFISVQLLQCLNQIMAEFSAQILEYMGFFQVLI